jgi:glycerophosphoryl diester phosphodiesterase
MGRSGRSGVAVVAHRGASADAPENTLAAVRRALEQGADAIEVDVRLTRDGHAVLVHDASLARTTDAAAVLRGLGPWNVADLTLGQVRRLDAGSWRGPHFAGERVPTVASLLALLADRRAGLLLEIKAPRLHAGIEQAVAAALTAAAGWDLTRRDATRLVVQSFDWASMRTVHRLLPHVAVGLLGRPAEPRLPALSRYAAEITPVHHTVDAAYVERVHALGMAVRAFTVNDPDEMRRLAAAGVDAVITDRPAAALAALAPRKPAAQT